MTPEAYKRFEAWKRDLEERLAQRLFEVGEDEGGRHLLTEGSTPVLPSQVPPLNYPPR